MNKYEVIGIILGVCVGIFISCLINGSFKNDVHIPSQNEPINTTYQTDIIYCDQTEDDRIFDACIDYYEDHIDDTYLGYYEATAYCPCVECCGKNDGITASGTKATENRTIAADPDIFPYGTVLLIDGEEYVVEDCGGMIKGKRLDIYFDSHEDAVEYGRQIVEVYERH